MAVTHKHPQPLLSTEGSFSGQLTPSNFPLLVKEGLGVVELTVRKVKY